MTDTSSPTRMPVVNLMSSVLDKGAFIVIAIGGSIGIVLLRLLGFPVLWVMSVPVGLILFYALLALVARRFRLREDRVADNCYYLGFIYTLVSLAYALYGFQTGGLVTEKLISDFGIALVSTIIGVMVRLILNQFRSDVVEIEREAREELADVAGHLKGELLSALTDFQSYRVAMHQSFAESQQAILDKTHEILTQSATAFEETTKTLLDDAGKAFKRHHKAAEKLAETSVQTVSTLEQLIARIEAIETPSDLITRQMTPAVAEIEAMVSALRERAEADAHRGQDLDKLMMSALSSAETLDGRIKAQHVHAQSLSDTEQRLAELVGSLARDFSGLAEVGRRMQESLAAAQQAGDLGRGVLAEVEREAHGAVATLRQHNEALAVELVRSREMTRRVQDSLVEMADTMVRRLGEEQVPASSDPFMGPGRPYEDRAHGASGGRSHDEPQAWNDPERERHPDERIDG